MEPTRNNPFNLSSDFLNCSFFLGLDLPENDPSNSKAPPLSNLNRSENGNEELNVSLFSNEEPSKIAWLNPSSQSDTNPSLNFLELEKSKSIDSFATSNFNQLNEKLKKTMPLPPHSNLDLSQIKSSKSKDPKTNVNKEINYATGLNIGWQPNDCEELQRYLNLAFENEHQFNSRSEFIRWAKKNNCKLSLGENGCLNHIRKTIQELEDSTHGCFITLKKVASTIFKKTIVFKSKKKSFKSKDSPLSDLNPSENKRPKLNFSLFSEGKSSKIGWLNPSSQSESIDSFATLNFNELNEELEKMMALPANENSSKENSFLEKEKLNNSFNQFSDWSKTKTSQKRKFSDLEENLSEKETSSSKQASSLLNPNLSESESSKGKAPKTNLKKAMSYKPKSNSLWRADECEEFQRFLNLAFKNERLFESRSEFVIWAKENGWNLKRTEYNCKTHIKNTLKESKDSTHPCFLTLNEVASKIFKKKIVYKPPNNSSTSKDSKTTFNK